MTTKTLIYGSMKLFILISTFLIILSSCDIIDAITDIFNGEDDDIITVDPGYNLIGTQVIGSTGGEINLDSIIVNIPSGAFGENNEISISVGEENDGFDEYGISSLYQISGLPSTINKPIRLSIKYHGTLEGDTLIAIGEMHYATSLDSTLYSYETYNASDSSGYLVYDLPVYSSLARLAEPENITIFSHKQNLIAIGGYIKKLSSKGNFMLSYPLAYNTQATIMGDHFENSYKTCEDMGFDLSARSFIADPAFVLVKPLKKSTGGWYSQIFPGEYFFGTGEVNTQCDDETLRFLINTGNFAINLSRLSDDLRLRATCGHEFLHLVQHLYEFYNPITPEQRWLKEATSVWIEAKYANVTNYIASSMKNRELYPFGGWQSVDNYKKTNTEQGYGLSVIIKGIVERYGNGAIVKIFEKVKDGILPDNATDPVDAVLSVLNETVSNFWHGVLGAYVLGHYYNSQVNFRYLDDPKKYEQWNETVYWGSDKIDPVNNKLTYKLKYHDLSGKLFKVIPGDFSTLTTVPLSFTVDDPVNCGILVCKYKKGSEITKIGEVFPGGSGVVIMDDVKPIFDAGYYIVVMVSNSTHDKSKNYQGTNEVELTIELEEKEEDLEMYKAYIEVVIENVTGRRRKIDQYGGDWFDLSGGLAFRDLDSGSSNYDGSGSFSNNVYTGSFNNYYQNSRTVSGNMQITFLDDYHLNIHVDKTVTGNDKWDGGAWTFLAGGLYQDNSSWAEHIIIDYDGIPGGWDITETYPAASLYPNTENKKIVKYEVYDRTDSDIQVSYMTNCIRTNGVIDDTEYISHSYDGNPNYIKVLVFYK